MSSYTIHDTQLKHADGTHNLEIEIDGDQAVIYFGSSFTLRLTEKQVDKLRDVLYDTSRELAALRCRLIGARHGARNEDRGARLLLACRARRVGLTNTCARFGRGVRALFFR